MRIFLELLIAAALVALAWQVPYRDRFAEVIPSLGKTQTTKPAPRAADEERHVVAHPQPAAEQPVAAQHAPAASPTAAANWMWDPKRPGSLDRPGHSPTPTVFTKHIYYTDEKGKKYWLDAQGKRHYEN